MGVVVSKRGHGGGGGEGIQPLGGRSLPAIGFGGDRDAVSATRRAVGMRLSGPRTGPSTRCRRRDYEGTSSTLGTAVPFPSPYTLPRWVFPPRLRALEARQESTVRPTMGWRDSSCE